MKKTMRKMSDSSAAAPGQKERKIRRRHTRIHLDSLRPVLTTHCIDTLSQCPKCQGLVLREGGETIHETVIRCLNCGWQPHFQAPMISETSEAKIIRSLTTQCVSEHVWRRW